MLNIVIFGAPGSGKGTQSARIVEKYGLNHISTGDVLRAEIKNGTELGKTAKGYIDNGQLIPDALMIDILASVFDSLKDSKGVIFDGFPRTIAQADALKAMLKERGQEVSVMLDLEVPEDELMDMIRFVRDEFHMTILLIEHDMKLVSGICERLTVLNFGEVLSHGATSDVLNDPRVITAYLGE